MARQIGTKALIAVAVVAAVSATVATGGVSSAARAPATEGGVDLTNLPIGTAVTQTPQVGAVDSCTLVFGGPGAFASGDWIHDDSTFDLTTKPHVDGSVNWTPQFSTTFGTTGATRLISSNDLPDHPTGTYPIASTDDAYQFDRNPNTIRSQNVSMNVPTRPGLAATPACLGLGSIAILASGSWLFDALDAGGRDAVAYEIQDGCDGHPQNTGAYHYHSISSCIDDPATGEHSPLLGYARDGFGIYGHYGEDGETLTNADLDACHGHVHAIEWEGVTRVMYHYHATWEYPYTIGCLRGTALATAPVNCNLAPPDNDFSDVAATASYVDAVDWAACNEIVSGSSFHPTTGLKRKQAVTLLWHLMDDPAAGAASTFTDVPAVASYHDALDWAVEQGVFAPAGRGLFKPTKLVTRGQLVTWLWHLLGEPAVGTESTFTDVPASAGYHDALDWAAASGIVMPYGDGTFRPTAAVKRSQAVSWLSALAAAPDVWAAYTGTAPDTLRLL